MFMDKTPWAIYACDDPCIHHKGGGVCVEHKITDCV